MVSEVPNIVFISPMRKRPLTIMIAHTKRSDPFNPRMRAVARKQITE
jgi:hypothetical protein